MPETVFLHVGGCGRRLGSAFWHTLAEDRGATVAAGVDIREAAHFCELADGTLRPRAVFADLAHGIADSATDRLGCGADDDASTTVDASGTSSDVWSQGHYEDGAAAADAAVELLRRQAERCETIERLHVTHAAAGGTGGGLGTLLINRAYDEAFGPRIITTTVIPPTASVLEAGHSDSVLAPYNVVFTLGQLMNNTLGCFVYQNGAVWGEETRNEGTFGAVNAAIGGDMAAFEGLDRYEPMPPTASTLAVLSSSLRGALFAAVPFVRPHFFATSRCVLEPTAAPWRYGVHPSVIGDASSSSRTPAPGALAPAFVVLSGQQTPAAVHARADAATVPPPHVPVYGHRGRSSQSSTSSGPKGGRRATAAFLGTPAIQQAFSGYLRDFNTLYTKKAHHHVFARVGLDSYEFEEAAATLQDLVWEMANAPGQCGCCSDDDDDVGLG